MALLLTQFNMMLPQPRFKIAYRFSPFHDYTYENFNYLCELKIRYFHIIKGASYFKIYKLKDNKYASLINSIGFMRCYRDAIGRKILRSEHNKLFANNIRYFKEDLETVFKQRQ